MRLLIAGPLAGGSLPVARATASAFTSLGYESEFIDYSPFADEFRIAMASGNDHYKMAFVGALERVLIDQINKDQIFYSGSPSRLFSMNAFWITCENSESLHYIGLWRT